MANPEAESIENIISLTGEHFGKHGVKRKFLIKEDGSQLSGGGRYRTRTKYPSLGRALLGIVDDDQDKGFLSPYKEGSLETLSRGSKTPDTNPSVTVSSRTTILYGSDSVVGVEGNESSEDFGKRRKTFINVAGLGHGPEEHFRSEIHDRVIDVLSKDYPDSKTIFLPSAVMQEGEDGKLKAIQQPPEWQAKNLHTSIEEALDEGREPFVIAHSSGSVVTMKGMMEGWVPKAVFISPTFLHPTDETFGQKAWRDRLVKNEDDSWTFKSLYMPYEFEFYPGYFDKPIYGKLVDSDNDEKIKEINDTLEGKAKLFVGTRDWNELACGYKQLFSTVTYEVEGETHAFNVEMSSVEKVGGVVRELLEGSSVGEDGRETKDTYTVAVSEKDEFSASGGGTTLVDNSESAYGKNISQDEGLDVSDDSVKEGEDDAKVVGGNEQLDAERGSIDSSSLEIKTIFQSP